MFVAAFVVLVLAVTAAAPWYTHYNNPFHWHDEKATIFGLLGSVVALIGAVGIWKIGEAAPGFVVDGRVKAAKLDDVRDYLRLRSRLGQLLAWEGAILTGGVLSVAALQTYLAAALDPDPLPREVVLFYGIYFTVILALIYVPAHVALQRAGSALAAHLHEHEAPTWGKWADQNAKIREVLRLDIGPVVALRAAVPVFAPLTSALLTLIVGGVQ